MHHKHAHTHWPPDYYEAVTDPGQQQCRDETGLLHGFPPLRGNEFVFKRETGTPASLHHSDFPRAWVIGRACIFTCYTPGVTPLTPEAKSLWMENFYHITRPLLLRREKEKWHKRKKPSKSDQRMVTWWDTKLLIKGVKHGDMTFPLGNQILELNMRLTKSGKILQWHDS